MKALRITIDPIVCDAYGYCAEILPECISLDEWGYPIVEKNTPISRELLALARRAAHDCPRRAITVEVVDDGQPVRRLVRTGTRRI